ncbi:hypothetical protein CcaverHIS002_0110680 [Cutaneotrichosporon cavernicola]|uniref:FHA domain-containing protein n=1 Tax=Cutaneotrichosporon cavernicola TaxID=279322 RepID=A0AA48L0K3_9TREE|nr:uncharacterized protein CcaverHIS019_0110580 [Cutaneotrichosporon cavernicola]BEI80539.1 hypothetical protein CcaverHIS002_0110680 [Cutaneotrichosporon cavernicola]BEI88340.1 hypothetical protein CcaverHIS019_0110580 [Cutaneotrichosporon cavernicola]BEI96113.1 hypothetical protein CcaverHIS631_0110620 [Cutaneotrichosporon cavernicola]BEJ03885.1 hypothetical protein CcaverHIS641_0110600 [Cutaneotrichosporon cavernicola]
MPGDAGLLLGAPALRNDTVFLRLVEETEDYAFTVVLGELLSKLCAPVTSTGRVTSSHPDIHKNGGYCNITGGYCIGRHPNKKGIPNLPSALTSRVLSRIHVKIVVDRTGALWLMDLKSLHGTTVSRGPRDIPLNAYSPFRLEEGDVLILGKPVISRDGVTHLPLRVRVHYTLTPPVKPDIAFLPGPNLAENLSDITLQPRSPTRGWGIPVTYESELDDDELAADIRHDVTVDDDGGDSIVGMGSPKIIKLVIPPVHDDTADSVAFTGSSPNHSQTQTSVSAPKIAYNPITGHDMYSPEDAAAIRQSILAIPPSHEEMGDDHSERSYGGVMMGDDLSERSYSDDEMDDDRSEHSFDEDRVSERSFDEERISEHSYDDDRVFVHSFGVDVVCEHRNDEGDSISDNEHRHNDYLESDEDGMRGKERMGDVEAEDSDDDMSENMDYSDDDLSDHDDEGSDGSDDNISVRSDEEEGEAIDSRDVDLHSQRTSDEEGENENKKEPRAYSQFLYDPFADLESIAFYHSLPHADVVPSSVPEETDFVQSADNAVVQVVDEFDDVMTEASRLGVIEVIDEAPPKDVLKDVGDDGEILVASSEQAATRSTDKGYSFTAINREHSPTYSPSSPAESRLRSPVTVAWEPRSSAAFSDVANSGLSSVSPRYVPFFPRSSTANSSELEHDEAHEGLWSQGLHPELPSVVMIPDEIEEPRYDEADESDAEMETATPNMQEVIYSIPPSPPASTSSSVAERVDYKVEAVRTAVPPTPPSPAYKALAPEVSTSDASSITLSTATMDAATNTSAPTPRKRKLSVVEEEASAGHAKSGAVVVPTDISTRPTRRRRIGTFVTGVALGVGIGVVSTFGALYQLGAE